MDVGKVGNREDLRLEEGDYRPPSMTFRVMGMLRRLLSEATRFDVTRRGELETRLILGFYDRPDIREEVADRLAALCSRPPPGNRDGPSRSGTRSRPEPPPPPGNGGPDSSRPSGRLFSCHLTGPLLSFDLPS